MTLCFGEKLSRPSPRRFREYRHSRSDSPSARVQHSIRRGRDRRSRSRGGPGCRSSCCSRRTYRRVRRGRLSLCCCRNRSNRSANFPPKSNARHMPRRTVHGQSSQCCGNPGPSQGNRLGAGRTDGRWPRGPLRHIADVPVLHWHGDNLDLPPDCDNLAFTAVCPNQAFSKGKNLLGIQFHIEADPKGIEAWLIGHAVELAKAGKDPRIIRRDTQRCGKRLADAATRTLVEWVDNIDR